MKKDAKNHPKCAHCGKFILPSEIYYDVRTSTGLKPVHLKCLEKYSG